MDARSNSFSSLLPLMLFGEQDPFKNRVAIASIVPLSSATGAVLPAADVRDKVSGKRAFPRTAGSSPYEKRYGNDARSIATGTEQSLGTSARDKSRELQRGVNFSTPDESDFSQCPQHIHGKILRRVLSRIFSLWINGASGELG